MAGESRANLVFETHSMVTFQLFRVANAGYAAVDFSVSAFKVSCVVGVESLTLVFLLTSRSLASVSLVGS
jgi:hypothetical protein